MGSLLKSIRFNMEDEADKELYDWLSHLPRGQFSKEVKEYWKKRFEVGTHWYDKEEKNE